MVRGSFLYVLSRYYLPLCFIAVLAVLMVFANQLQEKKHQYEVAIYQLESLQNTLSRIGKLAGKDQSSRLVFQQEMEGLHQQQLSLVLQTSSLEIMKSKPAFEVWDEELNSLIELWSINSLDQTKPDNFEVEMQSKLNRSIKKSDELLYLAKGEAERYSRLIIWIIWFSLLGITFSIFQLYTFFTLRLYRPLEKLKRGTTDLLEKACQDTEAFDAQYLIKPLASNIRHYNDQINELAKVSDLIGEGDFEQDFSFLKNSGVLGNSILRMKEKIQSFLEDEKRRSWGSHGKEHFAKVLRENELHRDALCQKLISELVPFVGANQGGMFLKEEEQSTLELKASYAWGRQKYIKKSYGYGEGLIGQVALEKDVIVLTDVPDNFVTIGSGLGKAKPCCIILLPLIANDSFQGVIELASFRCFQEHEISFLKGLCESTAAVLATLTINFRTKQLLEEANESNMHLKAQEEELRQNAEELMSTQEAMEKKETELTSLFNSINHAMLMCELNTQAELIKINKKFSDLIDLSEQEYSHSQLFELIEVPDWHREDYKKLWDDLLEGNSQNLECKIRCQNSLWISASLSPVIDKRGEVEKIIVLANDISHKKTSELEFMAQAEAIMEKEEALRSFNEELKGLQLKLQNQIRDMSDEKAKNVAILEGCVDGVISFNEAGIVEFFNKSAEEIWKISSKEVLGRKIQKFIPLEIQEKENDLFVCYNKNGQKKELDERTEVPLIEATGNEVEVLLTLTKVKVNGSYIFTAFIQKVAVELF